MRRAAKKDDNHDEIVAVFKQLGCGWLDLYQVGDGVPDGVAEINTHNVFVEIKDGAKPPSGRRLTGPERKFHETWHGAVIIIETVDDVLRLVNGIRRGVLQCPFKTPTSR